MKQGAPPGSGAPTPVPPIMPFPMHPAAMYGQIQHMQQQLQQVQQQVHQGTGPLTTAQQAELARARQRGQRAAAAKQKLSKQKAALAAKRAKEAQEAAAKKEAAQKRRREARGEDDDDSEDDETRVAAAREAIDATDVSALAAMTPEEQNDEIQRRLSGVECVKEQKRLKRLLRNRVSAQQARERKKSYLTQLEDKSKEQENEIAMLNQKVQSLQQENQMLRQVVKNMRLKDSS
eukprot:scaffold433717_cov44-Prasinocladus_malaysianus.AAC.1